MKILTSAQMAEVDRLSTEIFHVPSILLMENAGRSVVETVEKFCPGLESKRIVVLCGKGNNGGDGFVVARQLISRGARPEVVVFADPSSLKGDALTNWRIVAKQQIPVRVVDQPARIRGALDQLDCPDVIVDALFGTGLSKPVGGELVQVIDWINSRSEKAVVVSVDIPSGLFADSAEIPGPVVRARLTVTFTALKKALLFPPAAACAGHVVTVPIGSPGALLENPQFRLDLTDAAQVRRVLPPRAEASHKGSFGHVYVVAGSRGKSGAALMTGMAALRSGAGLVTVWLPRTLQHDAVGKFPELMTEFLPDTEEGSLSEEGAPVFLAGLTNADTLVLGPGLTTHDETQKFVRTLVRESSVPVVLDADGLNAFSGSPTELRNDRGQPVVITPHPGEMARLIQRTIADVQKERLKTAEEFSAQNGCFTVLKGHQSIIATPGRRLFVNGTGNPGMATGGSGDILAGIVGRFVGGWSRKFHNTDPETLADYVCAAVYLHGLAGDLASEEKGMESMTATDLLPHLPSAFKKVLGA